MTLGSIVLFWSVISLVISSNFGYNVLIFCPLPSKSHYSLCREAADALTDRGHEVSLISPYKSENSKFHDLSVPDIANEKDNQVKQNYGPTKKSAYDLIRMLSTEQAIICEKVFSNERIKNVLTDKLRKFDIVIFDYFMNEMSIGFGVKYNCPVIALSSVSLMHCLAGMTNNPVSVATVPNIFSSYTGDMNLWQRLRNFISTLMQEIFREYHMKPIQSALYEKYFPEETKKVSYGDLTTKISGIFLNSHPSIGIARPLLPNTIEIGGFHITDPKLLPKDLQKVLDDAEDGAIYFSMGSNLKSSEINSELKSLLLKSFENLKQTVIWKYEEDLPEKPKNVVIQKWMPQTSILAHPNVKLFISHGGLLSCIEAAHFGVPLLAIPIFGDQKHNSKSLHERGNGIMLEFQNITKLSFEWALREALKNPRYTKKAREIYNLYHDRPIKPRDLLTFHVEHIIRSRGAKHLTPASLSRFSFLLLDVITIISISIFITIVIFLCVFRKCYRLLKKQPEKSKKIYKKE